MNFDQGSSILEKQPQKSTAEMQKNKKEESRKRLERIKAEAKAEAERRAAVAAQNEEAKRRSIAEAEAQKVKQELEEMRALQALKDVIKPKQSKAEVVQMTETKQYGNAKGTKRVRDKAQKIEMAKTLARKGELKSAGIGVLKNRIGCSDAIAAEIQAELEKEGLAKYNDKGQCKLIASQ